MGPAGRRVEGLQRSDTEEPSKFLKIPMLGHQKSLQDLIGEELSSSGDGSLEMVELLVGRDATADPDMATLEESVSETHDETSETMAASTSGRKSSHDQETTKLHKATRFPHVSLWRRLIKRFFSPMRPNTNNFEADVQYRRQATPEQAKIVYSHKRRQILREAILVHLLPVAINFTLLGLYMRRVLWTPPWPTTNVLNALQFAAKVHESLMIASLVSILLHHVRYRLLSPGPRGLPLGLITSPFRLLDITFLWSRAFLSTLKSPERFRISEVITIVIHVFLFMLAAVLGPASAISMLPRLGEWQLAKTITNVPFYNMHNGDCDSVYQFYMGAESADIYPKTITANLSPEACDYNNLSLTQTNSCPRLGLTNILQGIHSPDRNKAGSNLVPLENFWPLALYNLTVQERYQGLPTRVISLRTFPNAFDHLAPETVGAIVDVTTSTDAVLLLTEQAIDHYLSCWTFANKDASVIFDFGSFTSGGEWPMQFTSYAARESSGGSSSPWKQPYVSSFCSEPGVFDSASGSMTFQFRQDKSTPPHTATLGIKALHTVLGDIGMGFMNSSNMDITPSYTPSAALVFTSQSSTTLCLVNAYWLNFTLSGSQFNDDQRLMGGLGWDWQVPDCSHVTYDSCPFRAENDWFNHTNAIEIIHLDLDWLEILDRGTGSDSTGKHGFFNNVRRACLGSSILGSDDPGNTGKNPDLVCTAAGLGAGIAEGLSKVPYHVGIHALGPTKDFLPNALTFDPWTSTPSYTLTGEGYLTGNWTNSTLTPSQIKMNSTRVDFMLTQKLYGYSFNRITIILAFVVLFLYVATVLIHISIMAFGTSWSSRAWKTLGEFYVLALQSPAPTSVLDNTGGGVKASTTWRIRASMKELQDGNRVAIVVRQPGQSDAEDGSMSEMRPDWKYS